MSEESGVAGYQLPDHKLSQLVISQRGKWWAAQNVRAKQECSERARRHEAHKNAEAREEYQGLQAQLEKLLEDDREVAQHHPPVCMSASAVSCVDLEHFQRLVTDSNFRSPSHIALLRSDVLTAPPPLVLPEMPDTIEVWSRREPPMPDWCKLFAKNREFFKDCALVCQGEGGPQYWKVIYCVQSPSIYVAVCQMLPTEYSCPPLGKKASARDLTSSTVTMAWKCNFGVMRTAASMPCASLGELQVVFNLVHRGGSVVTTDDSPVALQPFLWGSETLEDSKPKTEKVQPVKNKDYEDLLEQLPWLVHLDSTDSFVRNAEAAVKKQGSQSVAAERPEIIVDEEELMDVLSTIEKARLSEAAISLDRGTSDFLTKECQGDHNVLKGREYHDAIQGYCVSAAADRWARDRKLQVTWKAGFGEHTEAASRIMVRGWCHRMQYFFDQEMGASSAVFAFTESIVAAYQEPTELTELARSSKKESTQKRISLIRKIPL